MFASNARRFAARAMPRNAALSTAAARSQSQQRNMTPLLAAAGVAALSVAVVSREVGQSQVKCPSQEVMSCFLVIDLSRYRHYFRSQILHYMSNVFIVNMYCRRLRPTIASLTLPSKKSSRRSRTSLASTGHVTL